MLATLALLVVVPVRALTATVTQGSYLARTGVGTTLPD